MTTAMTAAANGDCSLQMGAEVSVLTKKFQAVIERNDAGLELLVAPEKAASKEQGVTVAELIKELTNFYNGVTGGAAPVDEEKINGAISQVVNTESLTIDLNQLFLHIKRGPDPKVKENNLLEYAFKIAVNYTELNPTLKDLFTVESVYFAIWNTALPGVVDNMGLKSIDSILKEYE